MRIIYSIVTATRNEKGELSYKPISNQILENHELEDILRDHSLSVLSSEINNLHNVEVIIDGVDL